MTDRDDSIPLPAPPPPRPAARQAAIEAAIRKFDGIEEAPAQREIRKRPSRPWWASMHRRPGGALVAAALIAVVSIPAIQIAMRDTSPGEVIETRETREHGLAQPSQDESGQDNPAFEARQAPADAAVVATQPASPAQPMAPPAPMVEERRERVAAEDEQEAAMAARAPVAAAAPPPPPPSPPPPPPAPEASEDKAIVVTGSRIARPDLAQQSAPAEAGYAAERASPLAVIDPSEAFLSRLQAGLRSNDRRAIIGLIGLPLRVNLDGRTQTYRSTRDVMRDFDRIFTSRVKLAVLNQRANTLMSRDDGRLKGNARLWFGCSSKSCPPDHPIRIREVNP